MKSFLTLLCTSVLVTFLLPIPADAMECHERVGLDMAKSRDFESALPMLEACDQRGSASAEVLVQLARIYSIEKYRGVDRQDNLTKVWGLLHRAATLGSRGAVRSLIQFYEKGEPELKIAANPMRAACLENVSYMRTIEATAVTACFGG